MGTEPEALAPNSTFRLRGADVVVEAFPDETVAANLATGRYYSIDLVGTDVLELLTSGHALHAVAAHVAARYRADPAVVDAAVSEFARRLLDEELIAVAPAPDHADPLGAPEPASIPFAPPSLAVYSDMEDLLLLDPIHDVDETGWPARTVIADPAAPPDGG